MIMIMIMMMMIMTPSQAAQKIVMIFEWGLPLVDSYEIRRM